MNLYAIGKIKFITYRQTANGCAILYNLSVNKEVANQKLIRIKDRFDIYSQGKRTNISEDYHSSAESVISSFDTFFQRKAPLFLKKFRNTKFRIDIEVFKQNENTYVQGKSLGFAIGIGVLSSFFDIPIKQNIATTGQINSDDENLKIKGVQFVSKKANAILSENQNPEISFFIVPNIKDQPEYIEDYNGIEKLDSTLKKQKKSVILCDSLLQSLKYLTDHQGLEKFIGQFRRLKNTDLKVKLFPEDFISRGDGYILGEKEPILFDISQKFAILDKPKHKPIFNFSLSFFRKSFIILLILAVLGSGLYTYSKSFFMSSELRKSTMVYENEEGDLYYVYDPLSGPDGKGKIWAEIFVIPGKDSLFYYTRSLEIKQKGKSPKKFYSLLLILEIDKKEKKYRYFESAILNKKFKYILSYYDTEEGEEYNPPYCDWKLFPDESKEEPFYSLIQYFEK